jgi:hypothetical protein
MFCANTSQDLDIVDIDFVSQNATGLNDPALVTVNNVKNLILHPTKPYLGIVDQAAPHGSRVISYLLELVCHERCDGTCLNIPSPSSHGCAACKQGYDYDPAT